MSSFKYFKAIALACFTVLGIISCNFRSEGTTTGNPFVGFSMTASSQSPTFAKNLWQQLITLVSPMAQALPPPSVMQDAVGNSVVISALWTNIDEVEFKFKEDRDSSETDGDQVEFQGPFAVDNLSATPSMLSYGNLTVSDIRRVKVKLTKCTTLPTGAPAGLLNNSIYIAGTVNGVAFTYSTQDQTRLEIGGPNLLHARDQDRLVLQIETANLIKSIDFSSITSVTVIDDSNRLSATKPCPRIDHSAQNISTCFRKGLGSNSNFGKSRWGFELRNGDETVK